MLTNEEKKEALELLQDLLRCNTTNPPGNESVLAEQIKAWLGREGIEATIEEFEPQRGNLFFCVPGKQADKKLMATGHLDTVPPGSRAWQHDPYGAEIEDGVIYGRGSSDMKGSVAAMLYAIVRMQRAQIKPQQDLFFLATAGEELFCEGAQYFARQGGMKTIDAVLVGEPSNGDLLIAHKGAVWVEVTTYGKTAHGSMPDIGINAISSMNYFLNALSKKTFSVPAHHILGKPTISVNTIDGGVAVNVVPDRCICRIDIRTIPGQTEAEVRALLDAALAEAAEETADFKGDYHLLCALPSVGCPEQDGIIEAALEAAGRPLNIRGVNYFTDASALLGERKLPIVIYGPGDDEHLELAAYYCAIEFYQNFFTQYVIA